MENKSFNVSINSTCLSCSSVMSVVFSSASRSSALWQIRSCGTFIINVYHNITKNILYDQNYLFLGGLPGWDPLATAQKAKVIAPDNHHCHHHDHHDHHTWQGQTGACQDVQDNRDPRCTDVHPGSTHRQHLAICCAYIYCLQKWYKYTTDTGMGTGDDMTCNWAHVKCWLPRDNALWQWKDIWIKTRHCVQTSTANQFQIYFKCAIRHMSLQCMYYYVTSKMSSVVADQIWHENSK